MKCPYCKSPDIGVIKTEKYETVTLRTRICYACNRTFPTQEERWEGPISEIREKEEPISRTHQVVYFIHSPDHGLIKIGVAIDLHKRLDNLRNSSAGEIVLLKTIKGNARIEKEIHAKFKHLRHHGEWFTENKELLDFIEHIAETFSVKSS